MMPCAPSAAAWPRIVVGLGLLCIALILIVDLPAGTRRRGPVIALLGFIALSLEGGFYAEPAAAAGLLIGRSALLRAAVPNTNQLVRKGRKRPKKKATTPDFKSRRAARRPSPPPSAAASAPASRP